MSSFDIQPTLEERGISRRDFLKFCSVMTGVLALPHASKARIAEALEAPARTPVIWLEFQDCAGCSESFLRASRPTAAEVVLDVLSVDYHETIMAASGHLAEEAKKMTIDAGGYLLVVEGSIPVERGWNLLLHRWSEQRPISCRKLRPALLQLSLWATALRLAASPKLLPTPLAPGR